MGFDALAPLRMLGDSVPEARAVLRGRIAKRPDAVELTNSTASSQNP